MCTAHAAVRQGIVHVCTAESNGNMAPAGKVRRAGRPAFCRSASIVSLPLFYGYSQSFTANLYGRV